MSSKNDTHSYQIGFALEILKLLAEQPMKKDKLSVALGTRGFADGDLSQKITRTISKLRDCGFEITSAPNRPYELVTSAFPVILSEEQQKALSMAAELLANLGFSAEAGHIYQIGKFHQQQKSSLTTDFHPPIDYGDENINQIIKQLQERCKQKRRFLIDYRNRNGQENRWDLDKSELRLHNGVLYLFALVLGFRSFNIQTIPNVEQNLLLRIDRITNVGVASQTPWTYSKFPTLDITYRLAGTLANYQPRRPHEEIISSEKITDYVDILTKEDYIFWFRQRMLQYGENAIVLQPDWVAAYIQDTLKKAYGNYCVE